MEPPTTRPPIPEMVVAGICSQLLSTSPDTFMDWHCCLIMMVMFYSYLGPSEVLSLTAAQIIRPVTGGPGTAGSLSILVRPEELGAPTKTGLFDHSIVLDAPSGLCLI